MLAFLHREIEKNAASCSLRLIAGESGEDVSFLRAFPCGSRIIMTAEVPRRLGVGGVALRLWPDGGESADHSFAFEKTDYTIDKKGLLDTFLSKDIVILPKKYIKLIELIREKSK